MKDARIAASDGSTRTVSSKDLGTLANNLKGELLYQDTPGYEQTIKLWNAMIVKRPTVVVRPADTADVIRVIEFVGERNLELSIRGGGHNIAGLALSDGGLTMDMVHLDRVVVDPDTRVVYVGPGCRLGDVDRATQMHGLATTLGFVSETGVAGLALGGGLGYLTRRFGWTVDDLQEVEIVTADGALCTASRSENAELFWALRGGGGNFGVVTRFVFRLHEVGPQITGGLIAWPATEATAVLQLYREVTGSAPRELTVVAVTRNAPAAPWLSAEFHGRPMIAFVICHSGDPKQAEADLSRIRGFGKPWADLIQVKDYIAQQSMLDATHPAGFSYYWKSEYLAEITDEFIATYVRQFDHNNLSGNQIDLFHVGGALNEHPEDDGAVGNRDAAYICVIKGLWPPESQVKKDYLSWVRRAWSALKTFATGGNYVNFHNTDETEERTRASYRGNYARLLRAKGTYDPGNLFRVNRNIAPVKAASST